jgi:hypothetical protein
VAPVPIQVTSTSAVIASSARVEYGAGRAVLRSDAPHGGRVELRGLLPGTRYVVRIRGASRSFRTPAAASITTRVGARGAILLNGSPFLPVMQWLQCPVLFASNVALGVNVFLGRGCDGETNAEEVADLRAADAYSVLPYDAAVVSAPSLFGWRFDDEPDQKRTPPEQLAHPRDARRHLPHADVAVRRRRRGALPAVRGACGRGRLRPVPRDGLLPARLAAARVRPPEEARRPRRR